MLVAGLARLGERPADAPEQQRRDAERDRVDHERRVAPEHGGDDAAEAGARPRASCPRASRSARSRSAGRAGRRGSGSPPSRRGRTARRRPTAARAAGRRATPCPSRRTGTEAHTPTRARSQTIISLRRSSRSTSTPAGGEAMKNASSWARIARPTSIALSGGLHDQRGDRHEQEPVAAERDHRGQEQPAEVAVAPQQRRRWRAARSSPRAPASPVSGSRSAMSVRQTSGVPTRPVRAATTAG